LLCLLGAQYVFQSNAPDFAVEIRRTMMQLNATLVLDAVGGELFQQLLNAAPGGSTLIRYANLSGEERLSIEPRILGEENMHGESFFSVNGPGAEICLT
jgi:NADPH:quinone reductase-like Zn-dependent oxidoreductase